MITTHFPNTEYNGFISNKRQNQFNYLKGNWSENNPWIGIKPIGMNKGKQYLQLLQNAQAWESNQAEKLRQDEYNSPVAMAQRQAQAGLNSDLLGLNAPPASTDPGTGVGYSELQPETGAEFGMNIAQTLLGVASSLFSLPQSFTSLINSGISAFRGIYDYRADSIADVVDMMSAGLLDTSNAPEVAKAFFPNNKRGQKRFMDTYTQIHDSLGQKLAKASTQEELNGVLSSATYNFPDLMTEFNKMILDYKSKTSKLDSLLADIELKWTTLNQEDIMTNKSATLHADTSSAALQRDINENTNGALVGKSRTASAGADIATSGAQVEEAGARIAEAGADKAIAKLNQFIAENTDLDIKAEDINQGNIASVKQAIIADMDAQTMIDARNYLYQGRRGRKEAFRQGWTRKDLRALRKKNRNLSREKGIQSRFQRGLQNTSGIIDNVSKVKNLAQ